MFASGVVFALAATVAAGLPNGDFETGSKVPDHWQPRPNTSTTVKSAEGWADTVGRHGSRCAAAKSGSASATWTCEPAAIKPDTGYIVEGWIRCPQAAGRLRAEFLDSSGRLVFEALTPWVSKQADWTYTAVDTAQAGKKLMNANVVRIAFLVRGGEAWLDDVDITELSQTQMANPSFEADLDTKQRIPYWNAEQNDATSQGKREGKVALSATDPYDGKRCVELSATGDWFGVTSVAYAVPSWTDRIECRGKARCAPGAQAHAAAVWLDSANNVLRTDLGRPTQSAAWAPVSTGALEPPANAVTLRPLFIVRKNSGATDTATAWIDAADYRGVPEKRIMTVLVDQVGYETNGPKTAILATNFFPHGDKTQFEVATAEGPRARAASFRCEGRMYGANHADWGWYFWRADFSNVNGTGRYQAHARIGGATAVSLPFDIGDDLLFRKTTPMGADFFFVQRCGFDVPGWHAACHLDDAKMKDGSHRDLTGGWHSAGDYNKLVWEYGDGGALYAMINAYEAAPQVLDTFDRDKDGLPDILDEAWWGAKFMAKIQVPETGGLLGNIQQGPDRKTWMNWVAPEKTTDNQVGTADDPIVQDPEGHSPLAIGGWARLSAVFEKRGIHTDYLGRAKRLWDYATRAGASDADPLLLISTIDLFVATRDDRYLAYAKRNVESMLAAAEPNHIIKGGYADSGDLPVVALGYFARKFPDDTLTPRIKTLFMAFLPRFISEAENPLGISRQKLGSDGYFLEPTSTMGTNMEFFSRAWAALTMYRLIHDRRALDYATDQIDFVFGRNTYNLCMMEGLGTNNPPRYHHRYNAIPGKGRGAVPGAIPNGFVRDISGFDRPGFDMSTGGRQAPSYRTSEPWLVHNVLCMLAMTGLHEAEQ